MDAARSQLMADNTNWIETGATQIEQGRQIDDRFDVVLRGALKPRRVVALICAHKKNITGTMTRPVEDRIPNLTGTGCIGAS
jgi:hypothetical protein